MHLPRLDRLAAAALFVAGTILLSSPAAGQAQDTATSQLARKPAWRWSVDERIAARLDPARAEARRAANEAQREKRWRLFGIEGSEGQPSFDGRTEPELLMPTELFSALISDAFPEDGRPPGEMKERIQEGAVVLGYGSDLWPRLERAAAPYLRLRREHHERAMAAREQPDSPAEDKAQQLLVCRARAEALAKAEAEFGEELFLRLLYEVVAPPMSFGYSPETNTADHLQFVEGGCR